MMSWDESRDQHICKVVSPIVKSTEVKVVIMGLMNRLGGGRKRKTQEIPVSGLVPGGVYREGQACSEGNWPWKDVWIGSSSNWLEDLVVSVGLGAQKKRRKIFRSFSIQFMFKARMTSVKQLKGA